MKLQSLLGRGGEGSRGVGGSRSCWWSSAEDSKGEIYPGYPYTIRHSEGQEMAVGALGSDVHINTMKIFLHYELSTISEGYRISNFKDLQSHFEFPFICHSEINLR